MILKDSSSKNPGRTDLAEWSRPERIFKVKEKEKASENNNIGRPAIKKESTRAIATNWFQPHLWTIIATEAEFVPGMSSMELKNRLQKRHPALFGHISSQVLGRMMANDENGKKVWSRQTLEQAKRQSGNDSHSTRHGLLVRPNSSMQSQLSH